MAKDPSVCTLNSLFALPASPDIEIFSSSVISVRCQHGIQRAAYHVRETATVNDTLRALGSCLITSAFRNFLIWPKIPETLNQQIEAAERDYHRVLDMTIAETNAKINNYKVSQFAHVEFS